MLTVNALGQTLTMTDRNGTVHTYSYDVMGRQTADAVTTLGSGVDGTIRRLTTAYDTQGNPYLFTAYDASSGGSIVNQVKRDFNGLGQLTSEWQSHSGAVTGSSSRVQYAYSEMAGSANHSRLTSMTYASGYAVNYNYASGLDSNISRLSSLSDSSNTLEAYTYLGLGTVVKRAHSQPGLDLTYIKLSTESTGDAGDQYTGLDRFGRVVDQRWINGSNTDVDRYQYGYDRDGNRLYKDNKVLASLSEVYTYDSLNQIASYKLGTLNGTKTDVTGSPSNSQSWDYDAVGNWDSVTTNSTTQTRTANKQNEITAVSSATTPTYDSNGNLTTDENNYRFVYDAWNKVVQVKNSSNVVIVTYGRDALHRHVTDTISSTVTDRFFSSDWQLLETKTGSNTITRNVWSPDYIDGLVLRDRDTDLNGTLDERLYALQDANWNTTALVNTTGTIQERYTYTPFGQVTFRDSSGVSLSNSARDWVFLHQGGEQIVGGNFEFRNRFYSPSLGRWFSNDPISYLGGFNLYRYVGNNPLVYLDPFGLTGCPCTCKNGMKDMKDVINEYVGKLITNAAGDSTKFWNSIVPQNGPFFNLTGIEEWLYQNFKGDMTGVYNDPRRAANAPCMRLCGECVGTDKIGHFFEEGFMYQQVKRLKKDVKFAIGLGEWFEGKVPSDPDVLKWLQEGNLTIKWSGGTYKDTPLAIIFGKFGDPPLVSKNPVGLADLEANLAGLSFWDTFFPEDGGKVTKKFNICDYVTAKWDENKNPNVPKDKYP